MLPSMICHIKENDLTGKFEVNEIDDQTTGRTGANKMKHLFQIILSKQVYIIGITDQNAVVCFRVNKDDVSLEEVPFVFNYSGSFDLVNTLVIGNQLYIVTYNESSGVFNFYPVFADLTCGKPFVNYRTHAPGVTKGFTLIQPFTIFGFVYYLTYNFNSGNICIYSLSVISTSPDGVPPLASSNILDRFWAAGWTHFAFFQFGGANFFFKTNTIYPNVNIDHINDYPVLGTVEIATNLDLKNAQDLNIVAPFYIVSTPYFITYQINGNTTFNLIDGDCKGWRELSTANTIRNATHIVPFILNNSTYVLFY